MQSSSSSGSKQQRVMDDLDALLADLQSTTQNISTYQHQINPPAQVITNTNRDSSASSRDSRSSTPPLPPPPPVEVLDSLPPPRGHDQPIYEPQNFRMRETTPTSDTSQSSDLASLPDKGRQQQGMSQLSSNLSELDQLLQDLNSAQFLSEVEKKSTGGKEPIVNGTGRAPPPVAPKPTRPSERATVESLLDELEVSVPSPHGPGNDLGHYSGPTSPHGQVRGGPPTPNGHPGNAPPTPGASTATKELDDLMASLSEFKLQNKPQQPSVEPAYAKPNKGTGRQVTPTSPMNPSIPTPNQLETMLGDLQSDMNKQGVSTKTKGVCAACNQPVVGQVITVDGFNHVQEDEAGHGFPWKLKPFHDVMKGKLLHDKEEIDASILQGKVVGLYFSAHWCPPCRHFTPELLRLYEKLREDGKSFEVVFVSSDRSADSFEQYYSTMPWLALPFGDPRVHYLTTQFGIAGIPSLILIDEKGNVITLNGRSSLLTDKTGAEFPWYPKPLNELTQNAAIQLNECVCLVMFTEGEPEEIERAQEVLTDVATREHQKGEDQEIFFFYGGDDEFCDQVRDFAHLDDQSPLLVILDLPNQQVYVCSEPITPESATLFVDNYLEDKLEPQSLREAAAKPT
ncbi:paxillin-like isoform X1 [Haliotis asinina]|uniref:paxillin-like isoform X1 n=1 Tax=Haliotis asinina TaxID=109174 RepID=UPI003532204C